VVQKERDLILDPDLSKFVLHRTKIFHPEFLKDFEIQKGLLSEVCERQELL